jgi:hypothetical protein
VIAIGLRFIRNSSDLRGLKQGLLGARRLIRHLRRIQMRGKQVAKILPEPGIRHFKHAVWA